MLDNPSWIRLLDGLKAATEAGAMRWENKPSETRSGMATIAALIGGLRGRAFQATTGSVTYELSSDNGGAPYSIAVWERGHRESTLVDQLGSSTNLGFRNQLEVNQALDALYTAVNASVESPEETVERLLRQIPSAPTE